MARLRLVLFVAVVVSAALLPPPAAVAQLRTDYYASTCPNLESIVRGSVRQSMAQSQIAAPAALRLFFHDCAVMVRPDSILSSRKQRNSACSRSIDRAQPSCAPSTDQRPNVDRLNDAGLRRVDHDRELDRRRRVAEHRQPVAQAGWVSGHSERQGRRGQQPAVPVQGVVRGHHRPRRQRSRLPGTYVRYSSSSMHASMLHIHLLQACIYVVSRWYFVQKEIFVISCIYMLCKCA